MIDRVTSFGKYNFFKDGIEKYPVVTNLFEHPSFLALGTYALHSICALFLGFFSGTLGVVVMERRGRDKDDR